MIRLVFAVVPAVWVVAIAIIAVQNATPVSFRLITLQSIEMPFGVLLAFCAAAGMVATALVLLVLGGNPLRSPRRKP
ncbi:MAG: hypothetical protein ACOYM4_05535 [Nodosilinea sp.]|jgi:uncharacterized integral membrane protein